MQYFVDINFVKCSAPILPFWADFGNTEPIIAKITQQAILNRFLSLGNHYTIKQKRPSKARETWKVRHI
jgi:hypothetical protein